LELYLHSRNVFILWRLNNHIGTAVLAPSLRKSSKSWGIAKAHAAVFHLEVPLSIPDQSIWDYGGKSGAATTRQVSLETSAFA